MNLEELFQILCRRRDQPSPGSYTAQLLKAGEDEILKKTGEEAIEMILAAKGQGEQRLIEETADLFYHVLVLLVYKHVSLEQVMQELGRRHRHMTVEPS